MTQEQRLRYLLRYLRDENIDFWGMTAPPGQEAELLRAFLNMRQPLDLPKEFLEVQDAYLKEVNASKVPVRAALLRTVKEALGSTLPFADRMVLWQGDITRLEADAIVNAANPSLLGCFHPCHGCIDNAIHSAAGFELRLACRDLIEAQGRDEPFGQAKITPGFNLPAKYVIHTVGPIVLDRLTPRHEELLESSYRACLDLAEEHEIRSLVFCCISTGEYRFPNRRAAEIAVAAVRAHFEAGSQLERVVFDVYKDEDRKIYEGLLRG